MSDISFVGKIFQVGTENAVVTNQYQDSLVFLTKERKLFLNGKEVSNNITTDTSTTNIVMKKTIHQMQQQ